MLIINNIPILKLSPSLLPLPLLYATNLQNYHKFEVKIHSSEHKNLHFFCKK